MEKYCRSNSNASQIFFLLSVTIPKPLTWGCIDLGQVGDHVPVQLQVVLQVVCMVDRKVISQHYFYNGRSLRKNCAVVKFREDKKQESII